MRLRAAALFLALWSTPAFCQAVNSVTGAPTAVLYRFFFTRVMFQQDQADKIKANGGNDSYARHLIKVQAGLTDQQEATLDAIASDWRANDVALHAQIQVAAATSGPGSSALRALSAQSKQSILDHLTQLQTAFGPGTFYLLDLYAKRTTNISGPGITPPGKLNQ